MKNKYELFIKYLDDQLSNEEREKFKEQLNNKTSLYKEFQKYEKFYDQSRSEIKIDQRFFNDLIPRAKNRIVSKPESNFIGIKYAFIIPLILLGLYIIFETVNQTKYYDFNDLFETFSNDEKVAEELFENSLENWFYYSEDPIIMPEYSVDPDTIDESLFTYLTYNINSNDINYTFLNKFNEEEFNEIYNEIKNKKYIGE
jgi:hypothetical protein